MAKTKKKRNKKYTGRDAATTTPKVTRVTVPDRSGPGKWWHENRSRVVRWLVIIGVLFILYGLISWLVGLF